MARLLSLLSLLFAAAGFGQTTITSVTPSSGPAGGGTVITIHGIGFIVNCPTIPCGLQSVTIG